MQRKTVLRSEAIHMSSESDIDSAAKIESRDIMCSLSQRVLFVQGVGRVADFPNFQQIVLLASHKFILAF